MPMFAATDAARAARRELLRHASPVAQMLIGDALGDAFGFGVEMQDAHWMRGHVSLAEWPSNPAMAASWGFNNVRGMYSDDAEMTVGLMKGLVTYGRAITAEQMLCAWRAEWDLAKTRPPPAEPNAERNGHGSVKVYFRGGTLDDVRRKQQAKRDPGNAPPMRSLPLAFFADRPERARLCAANADSTHPHPKARAASYVVASAARWLMLEGGDRAGVVAHAAAELKASALAEAETLGHLERVDALPDYHEYGDRLRLMPADVHALLCGPQPCPEAGCYAGADGKSPMHGLWTDSMRTAAVVCYILKFHRGLQGALLTSVDVGGDVDSVAALTAGIIGGSVGLDFGDGGVPWKFLEELEGVEYLMARAAEFEQWLVQQALL